MNSSTVLGNSEWNISQLGSSNVSHDAFQEEFLLGEYGIKRGEECNDSLDYIFRVIDAFLGACILAGNTFTITVFIFGRHLYRSHMNAFLLSLAVSDILLALIVIPSYAAYCTGCTLSLSSLCWFFEGGKDYTFLASVFNLLAISYDRHLAVFRPLLYNLQMTEKRVIFILILTWLLPFILASLRNVWQHVGDAAEVERRNYMYTYVLFFVFVLIPILTVCVVNIRVIHAIKSQLRKIQGTAPNVQTPGFPGSISNVNQAQDNEILKRRRGTLSCVLVVALFVICWLPRGTYFVFRLFNRLDLSHPLLIKLSITFLLFQSSLNPVVYSFFRSEFRHTARRLIITLQEKVANFLCGI